MPLSAGDVVRVFFQTTTPPKFKRCVIVTLEPKPVVLLISSDIGPYIESRPKLKAAQVLIDSANHDFMRYDSWIDCGQPHGYPEGWIEHAINADPRARLGRISVVVAREILIVTENSDLLSKKQKDLLAAAFTEYR